MCNAVYFFGKVLYMKIINILAFSYFLSNPLINSSILAQSSKHIPIGNGKDEVHLIQANFKGDVFIIWGVKNGKEPEFEGKTRVYRIPKNGILVSKLNDN